MKPWLLVAATATVAAASFAPSPRAPRQRTRHAVHKIAPRAQLPADDADDAAAVSTTATTDDPQWPSDERWLPCHTTASLEIEHAPIGDLYDAYCDLTRMTEWAPILQSVTYDPATRVSNWTLGIPRSLALVARAAGFAEPAVRWRAVSAEERDRHLLRWRSLSGIENEGSVRFEEVVTAQGGPAVAMHICLSYRPPFGTRALAESWLVQSFVRRQMLTCMARLGRRVGGDGDIRLVAPPPPEAEAVLIARDDRLADPSPGEGDV